MSESSFCIILSPNHGSSTPSKFHVSTPASHSTSHAVLPSCLLLPTASTTSPINLDCHHPQLLPFLPLKLPIPIHPHPYFRNPLQLQVGLAPLASSKYLFLSPSYLGYYRPNFDS